MPAFTNAIQGGFDTILKWELIRLEGTQHQDPETGGKILEGSNYIDQYTNRIFGAPFQLMDSVDRRFPSVNTHLGNEYLRNFILNSPILHIKPGMPKYTGGADPRSIVYSLKEIYVDHSQGMSYVESLLTELAGGTIFSRGSKLQKRMFGFRETYYQYMSHVNYMCRSMATFLALTSSNNLPRGTWINGKNGGYAWGDFKYIDWSNYRMLSSSRVMSPVDQLNKMGSATLIGAGVSTLGAAFKETCSAMGSSASAVAKGVAGLLKGDDALSAITDALTGIGEAFSEAGSNTASYSKSAFKKAADTSVIDVICDKISCVMFMVEPISFEESLQNETKQSVIESTLDGLTSSVGSEIAFITGSDVDLGLIEGVTEFLGDTLSTAGNALADLVEPLTGGFVSNLFHGAIQSIKGQKMIYPDIYDKSSSTTDYQFTVNLSTPYGDVYNYYMNIVVPLMHLIALAAPRMVTSNSIASPFLVQAFIPGMCTCHLGIISNMQIIKNPNAKHVSVQGFPLDVTVKFTVKELYNSLSISPANDPASFLFNETLNDYMANLGGLQPSINTYSNQRKNAFNNMAYYFTSGEYKNDVANDLLMKAEDAINPFTGR